jgi:2-polyprenyl-3-methyl-5-hydroxy-6-metoxy-1,4-benzoquinol methylase
MNEYSFDEVLRQCPICASPSFAWFETTVYRGAILQNQICKQCGMVFLSPRMTERNMIRFYKNQYRAHDIESGKPIQWVIEKEQERARYQVDLLAEWNQAPRRFLDIGASSGQLLRMASEMFDCVSIGVEPGDVYRANGSQTFKFYSSVDALISANEALFDVITMSHVLEHLPEPVAFLSNLRAHVLKEDGALFVEVPNLYGHPCFEPSHLYSFTDRTLTMILHASGFDVMNIKMHSPPKDIGWRNISVLTRPSNHFSIKHPRQFFLPAWIKVQRMVGLSGTRHWYGYLYQQVRRKLSGTPTQPGA